MSVPTHHSPGAGASAPTRRRIAVASFIGTAIEFYDFYIYGTAALVVTDDRAVDAT